ncbi:hypothetical protein MPER_04817 [Moniliophthora perniciosa FA553]|nr:hypothetical protein MPER_04817 [Moniliophthora perniciosa FA553]
MSYLLSGYWLFILVVEIVKTVRLHVLEQQEVGKQAYPASDMWLDNVVLTALYALFLCTELVELALSRGPAGEPFELRGFGFIWNVLGLDTKPYNLLRSRGDSGLLQVTALQFDCVQKSIISLVSYCRNGRRFYLSISFQSLQKAPYALDFFITLLGICYTAVSDHIVNDLNDVFRNKNL